MNDPHEIIDNLSPEDAFVILRRLAAQDEKLAAEIAAQALAYLSGVEAEEITGALRDELEMLTPEEVWDRSGRTRDGYVDTSEAAYQMIEEMLEPFLDEMRKYRKTGLAWEAQQMCMGLLLGFYEFEYESKTEFKDWATDAPFGFASEVLDAWREGDIGAEERQEVREFIEGEMPRWANLLLANW